MREKRIKIDSMLWELCNVQHMITERQEGYSNWGLRKLKNERKELIRRITQEACSSKPIQVSRIEDRQ